VVVKLPKRIRAKLRRARSLTLKLLVTVADGAGNSRKVSARAKLRP
jgi:hypothetical protein